MQVYIEAILSCVIRLDFVPQISFLFIFFCASLVSESINKK